MMSTVGSLMGVYGAIDEIVGGDQVNQIDVASRYLPVFADPLGGPGWSKEILDLAQKYVTNDATLLSYPALDAALAELAEADLTPSEKGRLIFAVGMLVRLDPGADRASRDLLVKALRSTTPNDDADEASKLYEWLASPEIFPDRNAWESMIKGAVEQGLLESTMLSVAPPCTSGYVVYGNHLVTRLETYFTTSTVTMDQVKAVLDPLNWHVCCKYFCSMSARPAIGGWRQVLEEFSFDCDGSWRIKTGIRYWNKNLTGGGAAVTYDLADPRPADDDLAAIVDNGTIIVRPGTDATGQPILEVSTSKNLLFDGPISGGGTAMWACLSGWADAGRDLVLGCAQTKKGIVGWSPSSDAAGGAGQGAGGGPGGGAASPRNRNLRPGPVVSGSALVGDVVNWLTTCIDDLTTKTGKCAEKAASEGLTADDLARSSSEMASRAFTDPYRLLDMTSRARRAVPTPPPAPDPAEYEGPTR